MKNFNFPALFPFIVENSPLGFLNVLYPNKKMVNWKVLWGIKNDSSMKKKTFENFIFVYG